MECTEPIGNGHMLPLIKSVLAQILIDWSIEREPILIIPTVTSKYKLTFPRPDPRAITQDFLSLDQHSIRQIRVRITKASSI